MIVHIGSELHILFGVLDNDGNVIEKIPYKIEFTEISDNTLVKIKEAFNNLKNELKEKLNNLGTQVNDIKV